MAGVGRCELHLIVSDGCPDPLLKLPSLQRFLAPPTYLQTLINDSVADLYQSSFFIGSANAVGLHIAKDGQLS